MSLLACTFLASALVALLTAIVGLWRNSFSIGSWAFSVGMLGLGAESICSFWGLRAAGPGEFALWQDLRLAVTAISPVSWLVFGMTYALGDSSKVLRSRWSWIAIFLLIPVGLAVTFLHELVSIEQTAVTTWAFRFQWPATILHVVVVVSSVFVLMLLERTFRASVGTMRWRIKSMILAVGVLSVVRLYVASQALVFRSVDVNQDGLMAVAGLIAGALALRSLARAGRSKLDVYPSQWLLQKSFTAILAGVYLLFVGLFAHFSGRLGFPASLSYNAFFVLAGLVVLAVLLQSDRLQLRLRLAISRHFQRPAYDYRTVWKMVNDATASRVDRVDLCRSIVGLLAEVFQALSVSVWLVDEKKNALLLVASTAVSPSVTDEVALEEADFKAIAAVDANQGPIDLDRAIPEWAVKLRTRHPSEFKTGGHRFCIPVQGRGELVGIVILGDRVSGDALNAQDIDLLNCVTGQIAASVMSAELSQRLMKAKELEAFQAMATFFVHDLKNAASTLQLTLQNLPVHFNDPAFREDALRGMGKSVGHINRLITRLGSLRRELKLHWAPFSANALVKTLLKDLGPWPHITIETHYGDEDQVVGDAEQIGKVLTNLLINAREAIVGPGTIVVKTELHGETLTISVRDSGCGMPAEFISRSLFRPFQTTKVNGLGIGMFQSRMIVEAHRGRLTVTSEVGAGTNFEILLPKKPANAKLEPVRSDSEPPIVLAE